MNGVSLCPSLCASTLFEFSAVFIYVSRVEFGCLARYTYWGAVLLPADVPVCIVPPLLCYSAALPTGRIFGRITQKGQNFVLFCFVKYSPKGAGKGPKTFSYFFPLGCCQNVLPAAGFF